MEPKNLFSNRFTITLNQKEAILNFGWIMPVIDEHDEVTGVNEVDSTHIIMSLDSFAEFTRVAQDMLRKVSDGNGAQQE